METTKHAQTWKHGELTALLLVVIPVLLLSACGDSKSASSPSSASTAAVGAAGICLDLAHTRAAFQDVRASLIPFDEAAAQKAMQQTRAAVDGLASSAKNSGQSDQVTGLVQDITTLQEIMALPSGTSTPVAASLQSQATKISADLDAMEKTAGC